MPESKENSFQDSWRKPAKSIKLVVKKRTRKADDKSSGILKTRNVNTEQDVHAAGQFKRQNPFGCSASKKANIERSFGTEENLKLFTALDQPISRKYIPSEKTLINPISACISEEDNHNLSKRIDVSSEDDNKISVRQLSGKKLPLDWSLKTRVRFTSSRPFNWCSKMLGKQEAQGLCSFVQRQGPHSGDNSTCFQQNIMYWIHPTLPWLSLFPRLSSDIKLTSKVPNVAENQDITNALQASWSQSFRSLFNLLRCGYCEYFYLCSAQFTVMFRAAMIGGVSSTSAYVTPTTKGLREGFDKEGNMIYISGAFNTQCRMIIIYKTI